jgi:secondary thiamine-phosphate synthase enzyme
VQEITVKTTKRKEIVDITETINDFLVKNTHEIGTCFLFVAHTTCALATADLDPGTDLDMLDAYEAIVPKLKYRHPHNPEHVGDHIMSTLIGASLAVPVESASIVLGTWQRVVLVEFYGPRERRLLINFLTDKN